MQTQRATIDEYPGRLGEDRGVSRVTVRDSISAQDEAR